MRGCAVGDGSSFSISIDSPLSGPVGTGRGISGATGGGAASGGESSSRNDGSEIVVTARPVHVAPAIAAALAVGEVALAGAVIGGVAETGREAYEVYKGTRKSISKANIASAAVAGSCGAVIGMIPGGLVVKIFKGIGAFTICATFAKEVIDSNPDGR